jgi:hypothetical protein
MMEKDMTLKGLIVDLNRHAVLISKSIGDCVKGYRRSKKLVDLQKQRLRKTNEE